MNTASTVKVKKGHLCCVPLCKRRGGMEGIKMIRFPRPFEERAIWTKRIRRENWEPKFQSQVCSWHFPTDDRTQGPTRFDWNHDKSFQLLYPVDKQKKRKQELIPTQEMEIDSVSPNSETTCTDCSQLSQNLCNLKNEISKLKLELENANLAIDRMETELNDLRTQSEHHANVATENAIRLKQADTRTEQLSQDVHVLKECTIRYENLKCSPKFDRFTGISVGTFNALCSVLKSKPINYEYGFKVKTISFEDQMLIFLMKMRMDLTFHFLSFLYNKNRKTITNVFYTFLYSFYNCFYVGIMGKIPSLPQMQLSHPNTFNNFKNCRIVIDCAEFQTEPSKHLSHRCATFSNYKKRNTFKNLIGIAPNGSIVYVSDCYGGSSSDKAIVIHSKFLDLVEAGDMVMADKGFLLHDIMPPGVGLVTPDFLVNQQFTEQQVSKNKQISSARVHVERAIQRMRVFKIISLVPAYLRPHSSVILKVVGFLANCMSPLLMENVGKQKKRPRRPDQKR